MRSLLIVLALPLAAAADTPPERGPMPRRVLRVTADPDHLALRQHPVF